VYKGLHSVALTMTLYAAISFVMVIRRLERYTSSKLVRRWVLLTLYKVPLYSYRFFAVLLHCELGIIFLVL